MRLTVIAAVVAALVAFGAVSLVPSDRDHALIPLADLPLYGDPQLQQRLGGPAVGAVDLGFGLPCAVYRNGPKEQVNVQRGQTVIIVCITP